MYLDWALENDTEGMGDAVRYFEAANGYLNVFLTGKGVYEGVVALGKPKEQIGMGVKGVALVESVFTEKFGTPRQSGMVQDALGVMRWQGMEIRSTMGFCRVRFEWVWVEFG